MEDKITVIVPVYKVEKYIRLCIDSILNQTYKNLEIILVDDGSPDLSGKICDEYSDNNKQIKVIHKENGGLSDARNTGLLKATGDYIVFVDSDDIIKSTMIEQLYSCIKKYNAKVAMCPFIEVSNDGKEIKEFKDGDSFKFIGREESLYKYFEGYENASLYTVAWNKIYKTSLFNNIKFTVGKVHEDEYIIFRIIYEAGGVAYSPNPGYLYRCREDSIMDELNAKRYDLFDSYITKMDFYKEIGNKELLNMIFKQYMHMLVQYEFWQKHSEDLLMKNLLKQYKEKLYLKYKENKAPIFKSVKIESFLFFRLYKLYYAIWKIIKRR